MYCKNCGKKIKDDTIFCQKCRTKIVDSKTEINEKVKSNISKNQNPDDLKKVLRILIIIALLIYIIGSLSNLLSLVCFVACLLMMIPPIGKLLDEKWNINRITKRIIIVIIFIIGASLIDYVEPDYQYEGEVEEQEIIETNKDENKIEKETNKENKKESSKTEYSNIKGLNSKEKKNFISALKECSMEPSEVKYLKKSNDWSNGTRYSFSYKGDALWLYMYDDDTVSSINLSLGGLHIYDEKYESLNYNNYYISEENAAMMKVLGEEQVGTYLKDKSSAKYTWNSYQRTNEYFAIAGSVEAKNSFGQKVTSSTYVEFRMQSETLGVIYIEVENKAVYGSKQVPEIKRVERKKETGSEASNTITLTDGALGEYGKYDTMDGKQYIRYYIPIGKYKATALVRNSMFYIDSIAIHKENGYDTPVSYATINLKNKGDSQNIEILDGQCISLVMGTKIKLEKIA